MAWYNVTAMARGYVTKKRNLTADTLQQIALGGVAVLVAASPPFLMHQIAKHYFKEKAKEALRRRARRLQELKRKKLLAFEELPNGMVRIKLTQNGTMLVRKYDLDRLMLQRPGKWDGTWRLVIYDIPHPHKRARDAFRMKIKQMGLYPLQKSVWVSPFECREELEFLCEVFNLNFDRYFCYLTATDLPREREIKKFFNLS